jgi:hypothetical protein
MRKAAVVGAALLGVRLVILPADLAHAQSQLLLEELEVRDPQLTATVVSSESAGGCQSPDVETWNIPAGYFACTLLGTDFGGAVAADGTTIQWSIDSQSQDPTCPSLQRNALRIIAHRPNGTTEEAIRLYTLRFQSCTGSTYATYLASNARVLFDVTSGALLIYRDVYMYDGTTSEITAHDRGVISVTGFTPLFDTFLTFVPGQQTLNLLTPAHPDGFRSADSFQVWVGDVRTMPDWSQAEPLTCVAAQEPTPGQLVSVADTLPDPAVGQGRYYLVASQSEAERRLGRQYVNGTLSARLPAGLPACH